MLPKVSKNTASKVSASTSVGEYTNSPAGKVVLTEREAAEYIGMSLSYLQHARCYGATEDKTPGPDYLKIGHSVRYLKVDLDKWLQACRISRII